MKRLILLAALSAAACGGSAPAGVTGTSTSGGTTGTSTQCLCSNDPPDSGVNCTPGAAFCDGAKLWSCTKSGRDAVLAQDCALSGSANNSGVCVAGDGGAQCGRAQPTCVANITSPTTATSCTMQPPIVDSCGKSNHSWRFAVPLTSDACSIDSFTVSIGNDSSFSVGEVIDLSNSNVNTFFQFQGTYTTTCTGSLTWARDVPTPEFVISATCGSYQVSGTIDGHF